MSMRKKHRRWICHASSSRRVCHRIDAQLALSPQEAPDRPDAPQGSMPQHEGMLFVFHQPGVQCFWMKNTLLPLTAAFVADDGTIVNLADMQPQTKPIRIARKSPCALCWK
jgi:hypothetical protein